MKKLNRILCKLLFLLTFLSSLSSESFSDDIISGIAKVIDGDTIYINNKKIRFSGIDAPESYFKGKSQICYSLASKEKIFCGNLSKEKLTDKIKDQIIDCFPKNEDRYKRIIAECFLKQESLSTYMVRSGYAFDYIKYSKGKYQIDENFAKNNKLGLWETKFQYPWIWRKANK